MNENFHYFALSYLNDWLDIDRPLFEHLDSQCPETGREALVSIANEYRVARCFPKEYEEDGDRLGPAYDRLQEVDRPGSRPSAIDAVNELEFELTGFYGNRTLSAASKFLWFKFRSPVVIYDSRAVHTLELRRADCYETYYSAWRAMYLSCEGKTKSYEEQIKQCCKSLPRARKYTAAKLSEDKIRAITNKRWFRERVFDKFLYYNGA